MKNLRRQFELYCYKNRTKGISNLMLYISLGTALVYLMSQINNNYLLYNLLYFDRQRILQGEVWRLFTYPLTFYNSNVLLMALMLCNCALTCAAMLRYTDRRSEAPKNGVVESFLDERYPDRYMEERWPNMQVTE